MTLIIDVRDMNGVPISEGNRVCAYAQEYDEISRDEVGGIPVVEVDHGRPKPIKDIPLFIGRVEWSPDQLAFEIAIEKMMVKWEAVPCRVRMGGGQYAYELVD